MSAPVPPPLTAEQRAEALRKAMAVRSLRRAFKDDVSKGRYTLASAITVALADEGLAGIRVVDLLQCFSSIGPKRAAAAMRAVGIAPSRRLTGLSERQTRELLDRLGR